MTVEWPGVCVSFVKFPPRTEALTRHLDCLASIEELSVSLAFVWSLKEKLTNISGRVRIFSRLNQLHITHLSITWVCDSTYTVED
jgi:hypothetical protein